MSCSLFPRRIGSDAVRRNDLLLSYDQEAKRNLLNNSGAKYHAVYAAVKGIYGVSFHTYGNSWGRAFRKLGRQVTGLYMINEANNK
jgi:hypothetical protein